MMLRIGGHNRMLRRLRRKTSRGVDDEEVGGGRGVHFVLVSKPYSETLVDTCSFLSCWIAVFLCDTRSM